MRRFSPIEHLDVSAYTIPTDSPESDGTIKWDKTTIVIVEISAGNFRGLGYTYADCATGLYIKDKLASIVLGGDPLDISGIWMKMISGSRNLGRPGIVSMAVSAVDIALWDLKARFLDLPLTKLLGAVRDSIPIYGSGGFTSYSNQQLQDQFSCWAGQGISMFKMKVGREPDADPDRVKSAREAIGTHARLFVDGNGAYSRKQALLLAHRFRENNVTWFEEPVSSDDLEGLRLIRDQAPPGMDIAAGEYGYDAHYFRRMLNAGAVDVLQADATRCAGITGFLNAASLCFARSLPLSAHTAPSVHAHVCCATQPAVHLEYFHDHVRIEHMLFEGTLNPVEGRLAPNLTRAGLGLELRREEAAQFAVSI
jgi:L-alanine-DL-glutamate epimerase-like enolase superfamily enzyme